MRTDEFVDRVRDVRPAAGDAERAKPRARARLFTEFEHDAVLDAASARKRRTRLPRRGWAIAVPGIAAGMAAVAVLVVQAAGPAVTDPDRAGPTPSRVQDSGPRYLPTPPASQAKEVEPTMELAANTIEKRDGAKPRSTQWIYTKWTEGKDVGERWYRFDGKYMAEPYRYPDGKREVQIGKVVNGKGEKTPAQDYAFFASLPSDPDVLRQRLYEDSKRASFAGRMDADDQTFEYVYGLFEDSPWMPPEKQAALYRALATIPNVTIDKDVVDAAGRHGIAVTHEQPNGPLSLILDEHDFTVIGQGAGKGSGVAILEHSVVDEAGERH